MKATEAKLLDFLKRSPQFIIPIYQRTYSWTEQECQQLWSDILRTGKNDKVSAHFIGSIVYIEKGLYQISSQSPLLVIDGQQRLTTLALIIEALARHLGEKELIDGFTAKKLRHYYLLNPLEDDELRFKLLLTQTDKQSLLAAVEQKPWPVDHSLRIKENFEFFERKVKSLGKDLELLCKGLVKLVVVDISLNRDQDNPQLIFESMNSTGRELSQADLIRNFILMGLDAADQARLYNDHWRPMEVAFGQEAYGKHFDSFMRHYLTYKTGEIPNISDVYEAFKSHTRDPEIASAGVDALVVDIQVFADYYCRMALGKETNKKLGAVFSDLRELKVEVAYPLLLEFYKDYSDNILSRDELESAVRFIESYVFRRAACSIPTNSLNKTFATFSRALKRDRYLESIQAHFQLLASYRRFPADNEFKRELMIRNLYNFRSRSYWLRRIENFDRKERVHVDEYTIEHILPQNPNLSKEWRDGLGPEWQRIQETWLHTLGNLTLTGYNSEYSDHTFPAKRDMKGGFKQSPLKVNEGLGNLDSWNEEEIQKRADRLANEAGRVWVAPQLDSHVLDNYRPKNDIAVSYSIEDHPNIAEGSAMEPLYLRLRSEILALDPCVNEEFLKLYVAYKAETNFVDIIPQTQKFRLILNMRFHELQDSKQIAKNVTGKGRWGNGDVEVDLSSFNEIPYAIGLIRQALEKQMGNGGEQ